MIHIFTDGKTSFENLTGLGSHSLAKCKLQEVRAFPLLPAILFLTFSPVSGPLKTVHSKPSFSRPCSILHSDIHHSNEDHGAVWRGGVTAHQTGIGRMAWHCPMYPIHLGRPRKLGGVGGAVSLNL